MASKNQWKKDDQVEQDLKTYISQNLKRSEVLDFMQRDFLNTHGVSQTLIDVFVTFLLRYFFTQITTLRLQQCQMRYRKNWRDRVGYYATEQWIKSLEQSTPKSGEFLLLESGIPGLGIRNTARGIQNPTNNWNPESKVHWKISGIQYLEFGIHGVESRIQDCFRVRYRLKCFECYIKTLKSTHIYLHTDFDMYLSYWTKASQKIEKKKRIRIMAIEPS